jgi:hypothetical protein
MVIILFCGIFVRINDLNKLLNRQTDNQTFKWKDRQTDTQTQSQNKISSLKEMGNMTNRKTNKKHKKFELIMVITLFCGINDLNKL